MKTFLIKATVSLPDEADTIVTERELVQAIYGLLSFFPDAADVNAEAELEDERQATIRYLKRQIAILERDIDDKDTIKNAKRMLYDLKQRDVIEQQMREAKMREAMYQQLQQTKPHYGHPLQQYVPPSNLTAPNTAKLQAGAIRGISIRNNSGGETLCNKP